MIKCETVWLEVSFIIDHACVQAECWCSINLLRKSNSAQAYTGKAQKQAVIRFQSGKINRQNIKKLRYCQGFAKINFS